MAQLRTQLLDRTARAITEEELQDAVSRTQFLARVSKTFAEAGLDTRAVLRRLARGAAETVADACEVCLLPDDGERLELAAADSRDPELAEALRAHHRGCGEPGAGGDLPHEVARTGEPVLLSSMTREQLATIWPAGRSPILDRCSPHSAVIVTVRARGRALGVLIMTRHRPERGPFTRADQELAQDLADRAALALDTSRLVARLERELSDRRRAESEREKLAMAIEQAGEQVVITDADGAIAYVNPAFESVTGYSRAEVLGRNPRFLKSGAHDEPFYHELWETLRGGTTWRGRLVNRKKDGAHYTEDASISPVRDRSGTITSYVAVKRDITEVLVFEQRLVELQKMEGLGRLAGGISHDFNNILSVILSCARLALDALSAQDPLREELVEIEQAGQRAAALVRQLLAFGRRQVLVPELIDLNDVLSEMEKMLRRIIGEDVALLRAASADLGIIRADPSQIERVIMNLAVNARDAMPDGGSLTIETANVILDGEHAALHGDVKPGAYVMLAVTDSGVGMDAATRARVFEPFFTTKPPGKGVGLGLASVYGIVKQSGGCVHVDSEPGLGATFKVYLPRESALPAAASCAREIAGPRGRSETILLVEDDPAVRGVARRILEAGGYTVRIAADGADALRVVETYRDEVRLVLTDLVMPLLGGRALAERLAAISPRAKILYMSGYSGDALLPHSVSDEGAPFIAKPFRRADLLKKIREVLDGTSARTD